MKDEWYVHIFLGVGDMTEFLLHDEKFYFTIIIYHEVILSYFMFLVQKFNNQMYIFSPIFLTKYKCTTAIFSIFTLNSWQILLYSASSFSAPYNLSRILQTLKSAMLELLIGLDLCEK